MIRNENPIRHDAGFSLITNHILRINIPMRRFIQIIENLTHSKNIIENQWLGDTDAGSGGGWVTDEGRFIELDRRRGDTHANIIVQYFSDFEENGSDEYGNYNTEYDDSAQMMAYADAQSQALENGWIRVTWRENQEFGAEWQIGVATQRALRGLGYELKVRGDFLQYNLEGAGWIDTKRKALQYLNRFK